jgi:hypothetical protein
MESGATPRVDWVLEPAGSVEVLLPGARPRKGYKVDLVPKDTGETRAITSDGWGRDVLDGVRPGRYRAAVTWDGVAQGAVEIEVRAGETTPLVLPLR